MLKRFAGIVFLCLVSFLPTPHVYAAVQDSGASDLPDAYFRSPYDFAVTKFGDAESLFVQGVYNFGYTVSDVITPIFRKEKQIAMPMLTPYKELGEKFIQYLNPQVVHDNSIPYTSDNLIYAIFCAVSTNTEKYSGFIREDVPASKPQISENWKDSQGAMQTAYNANALLGLVQKTPKNSKYNWDRPPIKINDADPRKFCDYRESAKPNPPIETDIISLGAFLDSVNIFLQMFQTIVVGTDANGNDIYEKTKAKYAVRLTEEKVSGQSMEFAHVGDATEKEVEKSPFPETIQAATSRGWAFNYLPEFMSKKKTINNAETEYEYKVKFFDRGASIKSPTNLVNNMKERMKQAGCAVMPDSIDGAALDREGTVPLECDKKPTDCKEADTWEQILEKLPTSLSVTSQKYAQYFPSPASEQLPDLMNVIFDIEVRNDNTLNPALGGSYVCEENSASAAGPFQIKTETYGDITNECSSEYMQDDLSICKTEETQLSRCITEDATELAMRALLYSSGRWVYTPNQCTNRENKIGTMGELYTAVCNYGEGDTILPHLDNKTYCEYVFDKLGWPKQ